MATKGLSQPVRENWRPVVGFDNTYEVSDRGRVRRIDNGRFVGGWVKDHGGHLGVHLRSGDRGKQLFIHTLVLEAFVGPRPKGLVCRHLDGDPTNNHVTNLRWGTVRENQEDSRRHGTLLLGDKTNSAKLSNRAARVVCRLSNRRRMRTARIAEWFGINETQVRRIRSGKYRSEGTEDILSDMAAKGRRASIHGEANGRAILSSYAARIVCRMATSGKWTNREIATAFRISTSQVSRIKFGQAWAPATADIREGA